MLTNVDHWCTYYVDQMLTIVDHEQTDQMSPQMVEERMDGADPCHDYKNQGPGAEGCW